MNPKRSGTLTVVCGSMFAGKSEELIRLVRRAMFAKRRVQVFKHALDDRYESVMLATHMGVTHEALAVKSVRELRQKLDAKSDVIAIEEAQFFDAGLADFAAELADQGRHVICAGLDQDFRREPFGPMPRLLALADEVVKLRAICMVCGAPASHTQRIIDGRPAAWGDPLILIGATDSYEARCRRCFKIRGKPTRR
jgi:thymidine kinase